MHPLLVASEMLSPSQQGQLDLFRRWLQISVKPALERLLTPFDTDDRVPCLTRTAQSELVADIAAQLAEVFSQATSELSDTCESHHAFELALSPVFARCLDLGEDTWRSVTDGVILEPLRETLRETGLVTLHMTGELLRSHLAEAMRPFVFATTATALKSLQEQPSSRLESDTSDSSTLPVTQEHVVPVAATDYDLAEPAEHKPKFAVDIFDAFIRESVGTDGIEGIVRVTNLSRSTIYKVRTGKVWARMSTYKTIADLLNRLTPCVASDLYPKDGQGHPIPRKRRKRRKKPSAKRGKQKT